MTGAFKSLKGIVEIAFKVCFFVGQEINNNHQPAAGNLGSCYQLRVLYLFLSVTLSALIVCISVSVSSILVEPSYMHLTP